MMKNDTIPCDSLVYADKGKPFTILQLTDMQVIDAAQQRTPGRLRADEAEAWKTECVDDCCYAPIRRAVEASNPDMIIITGDIVYGEFDDSGRALDGMIAFMESLEIPWAPVFGNHDNESKIGVSEQCRRLEAAPHCLFHRGNTDGNSNYTVGICDRDTNGEAALVRILYMMDSNTCFGGTDPAIARVYGFTDAQRRWFADTAAALQANQKKRVPGFACFHIPTQDYIRAMIDAGYQTEDDGGVAGNYIIAGTDPATEHDRDIPSPNTCEDSNPETVFAPAHPCDNGYKNERMPLDSFPKTMSEQFVCAHVDGVFMGHCHQCQLSVMGRDGIRYTHGVKTGTYDYHTRGRIGGTVITLSADKNAFFVKGLYI